MTTSVAVAGADTKSASAKRYRLPGIEREGIAQLSLLETALWPLRGGRLDASTFETTYTFRVADTKRTASVRVYAPQGLQAIDEYVLWGLLGISLSRPHAEATLLATPYWLIKRLGMSLGGFQYDQLRASLERLALVAYQNTGFYNPVSQQHERLTMHFFSSFLPTRGRGGEVATDRVWRIEWDRHFIEMCRATGGSLLFDLDLYRALSPASRRLFLKLKDRFWRSKRVFLNVHDLTIQGLGFSADRPLKKRKYDLTACIRELLDHQVIELGRGQSDPRELFLRRGKGCYVVVFYEGEYFRAPQAGRTVPEPQPLSGEPLWEPLRAIGVDEPGIRRILRQYPRELIQQWVNVTDMAMHDRPQGFPGFKVSPAAFLIDALQNQRMPPEWSFAHEKQRRRAQWEQERAQVASEERDLRDAYDQERRAALGEFLRGPAGRPHFETALEAFLVFYQAVEPHRSREAATEAATAKVERERFQFPDFGVWLLERNGA